MDKALLHKAWQIADDALRPQATAADGDSGTGIVRDNIHLLAEAGLFGLGIAPDFGGLGADEATRHEYAEILASACGVTAFTQQQLQTGIKFLAESRNGALKQALLPGIASGGISCGIALSHLRRSGTPMVQAAPTAGGYRINGVIPWLTGWSLLDGFVLGASIENGQHLFAYVERAYRPAALRASAPLPLIVMAASNTVEVEIHDLVIPHEFVLGIQPAQELQRLEQKTLTTHAALPLGCGRAGAQWLRDQAGQSGQEELSQTALALTFELDRCRREALTWNCDCVGHPDYLTHALRARASAIVLALRAAAATVTAAGGRAHLRHSVPQRLLREAQFYMTAVQTPEVKASVLDHLVSPLFGL